MRFHSALSQIEKDGLDDIVGWLPHGRSFRIHKRKEFDDIILPKYFANITKKSFNRQLNRYGLVL